MTTSFPAARSPKHDAIQYHKAEKAGVEFTLAKNQRRPTSWFPVTFFMENHVCHLIFYIITIKKAPIFSEKSKIDA